MKVVWLLLLFSCCVVKGLNVIKFTLSKQGEPDITGYSLQEIKDVFDKKFPMKNEPKFKDEATETLVKFFQDDRLPPFSKNEADFTEEETQIVYKIFLEYFGDILQRIAESHGYSLIFEDM